MDSRSASDAGLFEHVDRAAGGVESTSAGQTTAQLDSAAAAVAPVTASAAEQTEKAGGSLDHFTPEGALDSDMDVPQGDSRVENVQGGHSPSHIHIPSTTESSSQNENQHAASRAADLGTGTDLKIQRTSLSRYRRYSPLRLESFFNFASTFSKLLTPLSVPTCKQPATASDPSTHRQAIPIIPSEAAGKADSSPKSPIEPLSSGIPGSTSEALLPGPEPVAFAFDSHNDMDVADAPIKEASDTKTLLLDAVNQQTDGQLPMHLPPPPSQAYPAPLESTTIRKNSI
jgi:hypothetical protein